MPMDMDQAAKMLNMRIKIDVWSQGIDERIRINIREQLGVLFCQLPPRRVWFYVKRVRHMLLRSREPDERHGPQLDMDNLMNGAEDIIANGKKDLCRLMYFTTLNHIHLIKTPEFDIAGEITLDENGARRLQQIKALAFGPAGSICDCAIQVIETKARQFRDRMVLEGIPKMYQTPFLPKNENIEMATRILVRRVFSQLLSESLSQPDLESLEKVLFDISYPTKG
ncbi:MAG: hypothetical protein Q9163_004236 [Psora crenata]